MRRSRIDADAARREASAARRRWRTATPRSTSASLSCEPTPSSRSMMRANARVVAAERRRQRRRRSRRRRSRRGGHRSDRVQTPFGVPPRDRSAGSRRTSPRARGFRRDRLRRPAGPRPRKDSKSRERRSARAPRSGRRVGADATRAIATATGSIESRTFGGRSRTSSASSTSRARFETFADLGGGRETAAKTRRADVAERRCSQQKEVRARRRPGESVGSVGETLGATLGETLATPDAHRAVDDAVDALVDAEAAGAETRGINERRRRRSGDFWTALSAAPRAGRPPGAAAPSVEEETEDSEGRTRCFGARGRSGRGSGRGAYEEECRIHESRARLSHGGSDVVFAAGLRPALARAPARREPPRWGSPGLEFRARRGRPHLAIEVKRSWFGLRDDEDLNASPEPRRSETNAREVRGVTSANGGSRRNARCLFFSLARVNGTIRFEKTNYATHHLNTTVRPPALARVVVT